MSHRAWKTLKVSNNIRKMLRMKDNIQKPLKDVGQQWENTKGMERCESKVQPRNHMYIPKSVKECGGMSPHTPKWTPTLGVGVPTKFQIFKK
jgi:hypothetical protein